MLFHVPLHQDDVQQYRYKQHSNHTNDEELQSLI